MELLIARNPEDSTLPYIVLIPLDGGIVLRAKDTWPRTAKIYCHRHGLPWPEDPDIVERIPLRSCVRRGASISIEADRTRESRSQFVITQARGREMIFWQNARTTRAARPNVALPTARAAGLDDLEIVVDTREKYAWKFATSRPPPGARRCGWATTGSWTTTSWWRSSNGKGWRTWRGRSPAAG